MASSTGAQFFETVVFRAVHESGDFDQSCAERLPGATTRDAAWDRLFAALRQDRALIGGGVQEVH